MIRLNFPEGPGIDPKVPPSGATTSFVHPACFLPLCTRTHILTKITFPTGRIKWVFSSHVFLRLSLPAPNVDIRFNRAFQAACCSRHGEASHLRHITGTSLPWPTGPEHVRFRRTLLGGQECIPPAVYGAMRCQQHFRPYAAGEPRSSFPFLVESLRIVERLCTPR